MSDNAIRCAKLLISFELVAVLSRPKLNTRALSCKFVNY